MASIYQAVRVIAVYLLFSSVLLGILQESPYKPYVRLFTSLLLVLLIVRAFSFESLDADIERILEKAIHADDFSIRLEEAQKAGQDRIQQQLQEELREKIVVLLKEFGYQVSTVEIELTQDYQIENMEIELEWKEKKTDDTNMNNRIDREQLKTTLAEYFSIDPENIIISIAGGGAYGQMDRGAW